MTDQHRKIALLSVSDKTEIVNFARGLLNLGYDLLSTGGTARALTEAGLSVTEVSDCTGFPEMMNGRVKTLHPAIHGGILGRRETDLPVMKRHGIRPISLVCVNLYPFERVTSREGTTVEQAIENIDIGGPAMIRSAAKNHANVTVVVDPADYEEVLSRLSEGRLDHAYRQELATKAFRRTATYDACISQHFSEDQILPQNLTLLLSRKQKLRYGENPHQQAAFYRSSSDLHREPVRQIQGKQLSFNNLTDLSAAMGCVAEFEQPACAIVKHANPCGVAVSEDIAPAYQRAFEADPISAFGGVIAFNRPLNSETMELIVDKQFAEVVVAPEIEPGAAEAALRKRNIRLVSLEGSISDRSRLSISTVLGGYLLQESDRVETDKKKFSVVSNRQPSEEEWGDLLFAWKVCAWVKSNAIVMARNGQTCGIGAGQMNRVSSSRIAATNATEAGLPVESAVLASDGFFPFRDGLDEAAHAGVSAVIQPGGSIRDEEVVIAANEHGIAMVVTGERHFRH